MERDAIVCELEGICDDLVCLLHIRMRRVSLLALCLANLELYVGSCLLCKPRQATYHRAVFYGFLQSDCSADAKSSCFFEGDRFTFSARLLA